MFKKIIIAATLSATSLSAFAMSEVQVDKPTQEMTVQADQQSQQHGKKHEHKHDNKDCGKKQTKSTKSAGNQHYNAREVVQ